MLSALKGAFCDMTGIFAIFFFSPGFEAKQHAMYSLIAKKKNRLGIIRAVSAGLVKTLDFRFFGHPSC